MEIHLLRLSLAALTCTSLFVSVAQAQFAAPVALPPGYEVRQTADMDGDGDQDIVAGNVLSSTSIAYVWFESNGEGDFSTVRSIRTAELGYRAVDMDGDGDMDMARMTGFNLSSNNDVHWMENTGGGPFAAPVLYGSMPPIWNPFNESAMVDLDGDGDVDVVTLDSLHDTVLVVENVGGTLAQPVVAGGTGYIPLVLDVGDYDGDGDVDLLWVSDTAQNDDIDIFGVIENSGNGLQFSGAGGLQHPSGGDFNRLNFEDIDGDGDLDIYESTFAPTASWFENQPGGGWPERTTNWGVAVGRLLDVDADGDQDYLPTDQFSVGEILWRENAPGATGLLPLRSATFTSTLAAPSVHLAFQGDSDGDLDLVLSTPNGAFFYVENRLNGDIGELECGPAVANSTGLPATIAADGSLFLGRNDVTLRASGLPQNTTGIFATSRLADFLATPGNSQGNLCLGSPVGRYVGPGQVQNSGAGGSITLPVDLTTIPTPFGPVSAVSGETWRFQAWYRDANPNSTSNFTPALALQIQG